MHPSVQRITGVEKLPLHGTVLGRSSARFQGWANTLPSLLLCVLSQSHRVDKPDTQSKVLPSHMAVPRQRFSIICHFMAYGLPLLLVLLLLLLLLLPLLLLLLMLLLPRRLVAVVVVVVVVEQKQ